MPEVEPCTGSAYGESETNRQSVTNGQRLLADNRTALEFIFASPHFLLDKRFKWPYSRSCVGTESNRRNDVQSLVSLEPRITPYDTCVVQNRPESHHHRNRNPQYDGGPMTVKEQAELIGKQVSVAIEQTLRVDCTVLDSRTAFNRHDVLVEPISGSGSQWVSASRIMEEK